MGIFFLLFNSGCSEGKINLNKTSDCKSISLPKTDTLGVPLNLDEIITDLVKKNESIFDKSEAATLINTNSSEVITFTVKVEKTQDRQQVQSSETILVKLNPGEESYLGCTQQATFILDSTRQSFRIDTFEITKYKYSITGALKSKKG